MGFFSTIKEMLQGGPESQDCCGKLHYNPGEAMLARKAKEAGCTVKVTGDSEKASQLYFNTVTALRLANRDYIDMEWIKDPARIAAMSFEPGSPNLVICGKTAAYSEVLDVETLKGMFERLIPEKEEESDEEVIELNDEE